MRRVVRQQSLPRLVAERPAEPAQVLAVKNDRRAFAGVENELHAPVTASERPNRRDVGGELKTFRGDIIAALQRRDHRAVVAQRVNQPADGTEVLLILLAISDERLRRGQPSARPR